VSRDGIIIDNFQGGINNVADPSLIATNEVAKATNVVLSSTGKFVSRPPFDVVATHPESFVGQTQNLLGYWRDEEGKTYIVISFDSSTSPEEWVSGSTWICRLDTYDWTQVWGYPAQDMTTYSNRLYLVNPLHNGRYWSKESGGYAATDLPAVSGSLGLPPAANVHYSKGRIYVSSRLNGEKSFLRYSNITSGTLGTSINQFPVDNYISINDGDGELLVKIVEGNGELFLFRSNSTWRLGFSASAEPTDGVLTQLSSTIGVDNVNSVVDAGNFFAVLHAGVLYQFAGYGFYPLNDYTKMRFQTPSTNDTGYTFTTKQTTAVSVLGKYILVYFYGSMYVYDSDFRIWTEFITYTRAVHILEAPRGTFLASNQVVTGYGIHDDLTGIPGQTNGLIKFALEYPEAGAPIEEIKCVIQTRAYDIGEPARFKRLFGWEVVAMVVNSLKGSITPIDKLQSSTITWNTWVAQGKTWAILETEGTLWRSLQPTISAFVGGLQSTFPVPQVIKIGGKRTFKRAYFTVEFSNDGRASTSPSRLDGLILYMLAGRKMIGQAQ
jgi:hypothetical protein